jgi:hypothetical protein
LVPAIPITEVTVRDRSEAASTLQRERWSHFLRQPAKVDSPRKRTNHHEDAETVFG